MPDSSRRNRVLVAFVGVAALALVLAVAGGAVVSQLSDDASDRPDDPTTEDTVGYVEGYWYDDDLPVDDRDDAVVDDEDELEAVVYRSMARVERLRNMPFEDDVPVDVVSREEFREEDDVFLEIEGDERIEANVTYEALFMVDDETSAADELEAMYGGSVAGYYDPNDDRIVLVSDSPDAPELDEVILGHELLHALQDQHFDLTSYDRETIDQDNAKNGLIEGDAVRLETEYEGRCGTEWNCVLPADPGPEDPPEHNWGIYLSIIQPYYDGPEYVDHLYEDGGWDAVNAAYDDPPESSSTVIHREDRDPAEITVEDRSTDAWQPLEVDGEVRTETVGETGMVSMFGAGAFDDQDSVIDSASLLSSGLQGVDYDQPYTNGWAGDELVAYVDAEAADDGSVSSDETGYVWQTEWTSSEDAAQFVDGYLELLEIHGAEAVDDREDLHVIDDAFPGAYALVYEDETVTIVHAPSVDELEDVRDGVGPDSEDTIAALEADGAADNANDGAENGGDDAGNEDGDDSIPGFAAPGAVVAIAVGTLAARLRNGPVLVRVRRASNSTRDDETTRAETDGDADASSSSPDATAGPTPDATADPVSEATRSSDPDAADAGSDRGRV